MRQAAKPNQRKLDAAEKINEPRPDSRKITFRCLLKGPGCQSIYLQMDQLLLFDLLGDIYTIPISGGTAKATYKRTCDGSASALFSRWKNNHFHQ